MVQHRPEPSNRHDSARGWREIIHKVRPHLWETGSGSDVFNQNDLFWSDLRSIAIRQQKQEAYTASVTRTNPPIPSDVRLCDLQKAPTRSKEEQIAYKPAFINRMKTQLDEHGDGRLQDTKKIANDFANEIADAWQEIRARGGDWIQEIHKYFGVPPDLLNPEMSVGEIGELAIYVNQLKSLAAKLNPSAQVRVADVPIDSLPSRVLERKLAFLQGKAERVSGSDIGDSHIAPLIFYSDGVQVDKRTRGHLESIRRADDKIAELAHLFFPSPSDYMEILQYFDDK